MRTDETEDFDQKIFTNIFHRGGVDLVNRMANKNLYITYSAICTHFMVEFRKSNPECSLFI